MVEVGFADVRHRHQLDRLAVAAYVLPHLHRQSARSQRQETLAEMAHRQGRAHRQITDHHGDHHKNVHHHESRQVQPAKTPPAKLVLRHQRPAHLKPTLDPAENTQAEDDLAQRDDPAKLLDPPVEINGQRNQAHGGNRIEEGDWQKQPLGDYRRQSHQAVNHERHQHADKEHDPADHRKDVNIKQEDQRVVHQGNDCIRQKQSEAQAQQEDQQLLKSPGLRAGSGDSGGRAPAPNSGGTPITGGGEVGTNGGALPAWKLSLNG